MYPLAAHGPRDHLHGRISTELSHRDSMHPGIARGEERRLPPMEPFRGQGPVVVPGGVEQNIYQSFGIPVRPGQTGVGKAKAILSWLYAAWSEVQPCEIWRTR